MSPQQTIAHYRITLKLGEGGMGEVWCATDTKLNRDVAIKILPAAFAQDPDRMARFTREAQVLASLNHPNIAMIHGVEELALVMELVPGPTLAERIAQGPIPLDEALPIARQIAEALEYAHERGIVHRDLKPANVKITPEGRVKVLDFGLAKAMTTEAPAGDSVSSPTLTMRAGASAVGMILGTAAYMSPEQARGHNVDRRADIWAFGVVLYEMLTGRTLFAEPTISDTLAAVLRAEADVSAIAQPVRSVVERCLRKDVRQRWQAIGDARIMLDEAPSAAPAPTPTPARRSYLWPVAVALLATVLLWVCGMHFREQAPPSYHVSLLPPEKAVFVPVGGGNGGMAISPDGRTLAFVAAQEGRALLWVRRLDSPSGRPLPGTENAHYPFWSPDNRWVGFFSGTQLKRIDLVGGVPQVICDATTGRGATWNQEGTIVFSGNDRTLHRVPASGGKPTKVTGLDRAGQENAHYWPEFLPDGRHFLYLARSDAPGKSAIRVASLDTKSADAHGIELTKASANASYVPPADAFGWGNRAGWLVFLRETALFAQVFDASTLQLKGEPAALPERPGLLNNISYANFSTSRNGVLSYGAEGSLLTRLTWTGRDGKESTAAPEAGAYFGPRLSPDGARVAVPMVERQAGNLDIWLIDLRHPVATRFTFDPAPDSSPVWSPDSKQIAFGSSREGRSHLYVKAANGATNEQRIDPQANASLTRRPCDWSRDGKYLLYFEIGDNTGADLWVLDLAGGPKAIPFLKTSNNESLATFSPDGKWIAYTSDEGGRQEVYVRDFPGASAKFQISNSGGVQPRWRGDGKELYYLAPDSKVMAVTVRAAAGIFERDMPKALFEMRGVRSGGLIYDYDVTRDGQRFLSAVPVEAEGVRPLMLVTDWRAELSNDAHKEIR